MLKRNLFLVLITLTCFGLVFPYPAFSGKRTRARKAARSIYLLELKQEEQRQEQANQKRVKREEREKRQEKLDQELCSYVSLGSLFAVQTVLTQGANPNRLDHGRSSLHYALMFFSGMYEERYKNVAFELIHRGANVNLPDERGRTPLHLALLFCDKDLALEMLKVGASLDARDQDGYLPLHHAASCSDKAGGESLVEYLVENGSRDQLNALSKDGLSPLDIAEKGKGRNRRVAVVLRHYGAVVKKGGESCNEDATTQGWGPPDEFLDILY